ncbi:MAG: esterase [Myxococcaceae bacterium]
MDLRPFHPDLRRAARWLPRGVGRAWLVRLMRWLPVPSPRLPEGITVTERRVDAKSPVTVRIIAAPPDGRPRPVLLWIHGGGYVFGAAKQDDLLCARFAQRLGVTVVSVDYRLAPEHPFPAPLKDCFAAYDFVQREAADLQLDSSRVIIGGASAGGGLAAALALLLHDRRRPAPLLQLLVYPMLDDRTVLRVVDDRLHRLWDSRSNRLGWSRYLGREPGAPDVTDHAAPARRQELRGLAPAWIGVGTLDLFHDEDVAYAARLGAAGVPTSVELVEGAYHGFDLVQAKAPVSQRFFDAKVEAMGRALAMSRSSGSFERAP